MIRFTAVSPEQVANFFLEDPELVLLGLSDEEMVYLYENRKYDIGLNSNIIGLEYRGLLVGLCKWEQCSKIAISMHLYVASKYHGTKLLQLIFNFLHQHFKESTEIRKIIFLVPNACTHVIRTLEKRNCTKEVTIPAACVWRKQIVDLIIYGLHVV